MPLELYATATCPYCAEVRDELEWKRRDFIEYDVETDAAARERLLLLTGNNPLVPVLAENGCVLEVGFKGRGCYIAGGERTEE